MARILEAEPPLEGVVPVLLVEYPTPDGIVNVTGLASSGTLGSLVQSNGRLNQIEFLAIIAKIADGLAALHSKSIIHCDLKPDNVVVHMTEDGRVCVWLIDFGDARMLDEPSSWYTQGWGAPEIQCAADNRSGKYSSRTYSWCLAQCAACLWSGNQRASGNPAWIQDDMPLSTEFQRCLNWDPTARPEAEEIAAHARRALGAQGKVVDEELQQMFQHYGPSKF